MSKPLKYFSMSYSMSSGFLDADGIEVLDELWFSGLRVLFDVVSDNLRICSDYEILMAEGFHFAKAQEQGFVVGGVVG